VYTYDLSSGSGQIFGAGKKQVGSLWTMIAGDGNGDNTIQTSDYTLWRSNFGLSNFNAADYNLDGTVQTSDYTQWRSNFGLSSTIP
jgi:hypothetical protein